MLTKWIPTASKIKVRFWDIVFRVLYFFSRMFSAQRSSTKSVPEKTPAEVVSSKTFEKSEVSLEEIIKQIVTREERLRNISETDPLISFGVSREDEQSYLEARRFRIQAYCTRVPFNESDPIHMKEAAEGYLNALTRRLDELA